MKYMRGPIEGEFKVQPRTVLRFRGVQHVVMGGESLYWGIIRPGRGCPQFPHAAGTLGSPLARNAKINLTTKSIRPGQRIVDIQTPDRSLHQGPPGISTVNESICDSRNHQDPHCLYADPGIPWPPIALSPFSRHQPPSGSAPIACQPNPSTGCPVSLVGNFKLPPRL